MFCFVMERILLLNVNRSTYNSTLTIKWKNYYSRKKINNICNIKILFVEVSGFVVGFGSSFLEEVDREARKCFLPLFHFIWITQSAIIYTVIERDTGFHAKI